MQILCNYVYYKFSVNVNSFKELLKDLTVFNSILKYMKLVKIIILSKLILKIYNIIM